MNALFEAAVRNSALVCTRVQSTKEQVWIKAEGVGEDPEKLQIGEYVDPEFELNVRAMTVLVGTALGGDL